MPARLAVFLAFLVLMAAGTVSPVNGQTSSLTPYSSPPEWLREDYGEYRSPLLFNDDSRVKTPEDWQRRRQEILRHWHDLMGPWPDLLDRPQLMVLKEESIVPVREGDYGYRMQRVRVPYAVDQSEEGWLLIPDLDSRSETKRRPAVLVVYYEPETSVGLNAEQPNRDFALQLTRRGFVTLSIGTPGGDARQPALGNAKCQPLSYHAYVAANAWQALSQHPDVDPDRIGVTGHSYGGKWALFAAALWDRFAAVAVSDPGIVFDEPRSNVNYWEPWYLGFDPDRPTRKPGLITPENPRTGAYREMIAQKLDLHEIHALLAPRPFLVSGGSEDPVERWKALNHLVAVNRVLSYKDRVLMTNRPEHAPNMESNEVLVNFFLHYLGDREPRAR